MTTPTNELVLTHDTGTEFYYDQDGFAYHYDIARGVYIRDDGAEFTMNAAGVLSQVNAIGAGLSQIQILLLAALAFLFLKG